MLTNNCKFGKKLRKQYAIFLSMSKSISEIAYELGFKHSQHFSRLFKNMVGQTPLEYRGVN
ncbi:MAG: helix-turn-helix domain-containing protein [Bacteroidales bacterium]